MGSSSHEVLIYKHVLQTNGVTLIACAELQVHWTRTTVLYVQMSSWRYLQLGDTRRLILKNCSSAYMCSELQGGPVRGCERPALKGVNAEVFPNGAIPRLIHADTLMKKPEGI